MKKMKMAVVFVSMVGMVFPMAGCALELVTTNAQGRYDMGLVRSNQNEVVGMIFDGTLMSNAAIVSAYGAADAAVVLQINTNSWNIASNTAGYAASDTVVSNGLVAAIASATPGNYSAVSNAALNAATATGLTVVSNLSVANAADIADLATAPNYTCSVAGSTEVNTTFTYVSNSGAVAYFAGAANVILFGGTGGWKISENVSPCYYYTNAATTATAPLTGWVSGDDLLGDYPVPVLETEFVFGYATTAQGATADAAQITNWLQQVEINSTAAGLTVVSNDWNSVNTGVWLLKGAGGKEYYTNDVESAYDAATTNGGDIVQLGCGTYYATNGTFGHSIAGVTLRGQEPENTTLYVYRFLWNLTAGASNCSLRDLTLEHADTYHTDLLSMNGTASNTANAVLDNLVLVGKGADHTFQVSGTTGTINRVRAQGAGHTFVLKGAYDWDVGFSSAYGDEFRGLLIKADGPAGMGNIARINVHDFRCNQDILLNTAHTNSVITDVVLNNIMLVNYADDNPVVIGMGSSTAVYPGSAISNVVIDGVSGAVTDGKSAFGTMNLERIENVTVRNVAMPGARQPQVAASTTTAENYYAQNISGISDGKEWRIGTQSMANGCYNSVVGALKIPNISSGVTAANIPAAYQTNGLLYIACKASYEFSSPLLSTNDPIWIVSGDNTGIHKLLQWGTCSTTNDPFPGITTNQFWIACTNTVPFSDDSTVVPGEVRPGKVGMVLCRNQSTYNAAFTGRLTARGSESSGSVPQEYYERFTIRERTSSVPYATVYGNADIAGVQWKMYAHVFVYEDVVYAAVFGGGYNSVNSPVTISSVELDLDMRCNTYQAAYYETAGSLE